MSVASAPSAPPAPGSVIAHRFVLQRLAGRGGMGLVFLARDEHTGQPVALKLLNPSGGSEAEQRFTREARLLASLRHPNIVSYVAHGLTDQGQPFLAMEWLEGEDLARRLSTQRLSLSETLQLMRRAAAALAVAHAQGIVHRDLKPSNLFLRSGQPGAVVLLDFGLAHIHAASQALTGSASVLGTPGYMAPEQVSSLPDLSPAADIFSLGCVLYECLAGQAPFRAPHMAAVLAKILFAQPAPLRTLRPEVPASLQALVEWMLAKEPEQRPADAGHLLRELEALEPSAELPPPTRAPEIAPRPESAHPERHLVSVLLATPRFAIAAAPTLAPDEEAQSRLHMESLLRELQAHSAYSALLADGSLLATFVVERGAATDQAALAAHCALSVKERWQDSLVALTTGLSLRAHPLPSGEAVDRAGELLRRARHLDARSQVLLDDTTAGLLGPRFQLERAQAGLVLLHGEHLSLDESRPLLGRPTPCVGREQELGLLELAFTSCVEDSAARALLVIAPAGTGKSRLRHELLSRLARHARPPLVLLGRADPMSTSTAHGLVGQAVRWLCGVVDSEPLEARRARLAQRLTRHLPPEQHAHVTEFLGELCATPFPAEDSPQLRAAREEPRLMSAQVTRALVTWLRAECAQHPVLLMLEDLHWSDTPSVKLVEEVLRELSEQPLLTLALARPEVKELFPGLWGAKAQELPLRGLSQKASARLVREVLGPQVPEAVVARVVAQAAGNALFLEELIRGVAEGHGEEPPGSVLAMLQSRLQRLEPEVRRVVLAGSIFGRTFWAAGVRALLEPAPSAEQLERWLRRLVELEVVQPQPGNRFPAEAEYHFHHALVRDAAYSLVPDGSKATGHLRAGQWLEAVGESEPLVLAEHYKLGGQKEKAIHFFTRACRQNCGLQRTDLQGALRCMRAALDCGPTGQALTELQVLETNITFWMEDFARNILVGEEVLPKLVEGSASWIQVVGHLIMANTQRGRPQQTAALGHRLLGIEPAVDSINAYMEALAFLGAMMQWTGQRGPSQAVLERLEQVVKAGGHARDSFPHGWWCTNRGAFECDLEDRPWHSCQVAQEGVEAFGKVGAERSQLVARTVLGLALAALGELSRAMEVMREGLARARFFDRAGAWLQVNMTQVLASSSVPEHQEEARRLALQTREAERGNPMHVGIVSVSLARVALAQGALAEAEAWTREACELLGPLALYQLSARICLSAALLGQGRVAQSRVEATEGVRLLEQMGGAGVASVEAWLALAEACLAQGDDAAAEEAMRKAVDCLRRKAADLPDAAARERFLRQVPANARVLQLAEQRWETFAL